MAVAAHRPASSATAKTSANIIRGAGVPRPADSDPGHFHDGTAEFWFVLEGHLSLLIEGVPFIEAAEQGDVLYAPAGRWHRTSFAGPRHVEPHLDPPGGGGAQHPRSRAFRRRRQLSAPI